MASSLICLIAIESRAFPGSVPAKYSALSLKPSPSESRSHLTADIGAVMQIIDVAAASLAKAVYRVVVIP